MEFQIAKKGTRPSEAKIKISPSLKIISFNAGICRSYGLKEDRHKYALVGWNSRAKVIAIGILAEKDRNNNAMTMTWTPKGTSFSFPIRSLLTSFSLTINQVAGTYENNALSLEEVKGFSKETVLLSTAKKK